MAEQAAGERPNSSICGRNLPSRAQRRADRDKSGLYRHRNQSDGSKDVLGMWVGENKSAKFWATVLNGMRNRRAQEIFIVCTTDKLTGFSATINAVFPQTDVQNYFIHQMRNSRKYVSCKDIKKLMADLKVVYDATDETAALSALDAFEEICGKKDPRIAVS